MILGIPRCTCTQVSGGRMSIHAEYGMGEIFSQEQIKESEEEIHEIDSFIQENANFAYLQGLSPEEFLLKEYMG